MHKWHSKAGSSSLLPGLQTINFGILLASIALLIYSCIYISKPGPHVYYSHFSCIYLSSCLAFQSLQVFRLVMRPCAEAKRWRSIFLYGYFGVVTLSGLIDGIALAFTPKPDTTGAAFLAFIDGAVGIIYRVIAAKKSNTHDSRCNATGTQQNLVPSQKSVTTTDSAPHTITQIERSTNVQASDRHNDPRKQSRLLQCCSGFVTVGNRCLMVLHCLFSIISTAGAVELALVYIYANPGTTVSVKLASGAIHSINYNCTSVPPSNLSQPTIWLESDAAHGIVDFIGLQTVLAEYHGRNSCSYDPPNFGWSDRLPSDLEDYFGYFYPLLKAIGKENEEIVLVGWGGGAENALMHTIDNPNTTRALVLMDASPDGIEWMDMRRKKNWTETQMLHYRSSDLSGRISQAQTILGLGIPWGLMPVFIPANSTGYYDQSLYPRFRAQGMKEDIWAMQYYLLLQEASTSIDNYLINTIAPDGIDVYAVMTYNAGNPTTDIASDDFYRKTKLDMANHIAGGNLSEPVVWCNTSDCSLSFPVNKPEWTANALMDLGI